MKRLFKPRFTSLLLVIMLLFIFASASATETSTDKGEVISLAHSNLVFFSNGEVGQHPLVIFFPGSNEAASTKRAVGFVNDYDLYTTYDVDLLVVTTNVKGSENYRDLDNTCQDVLGFVQSASGYSEVIIDAVSLGGHAGYYCANLLQDNQISIKELNIADGVINIEPDVIKKLTDGGCKVNIFASTQDRNISNRTRDLIKNLDKENIPLYNGEIYHVSHGKVLSEAIHNNGLHSEYKMR